CGAAAAPAPAFESSPQWRPSPSALQTTQRLLLAIGEARRRDCTEDLLLCAWGYLLRSGRNSLDCFCRLGTLDYVLGYARPSRKREHESHVKSKSKRRVAPACEGVGQVWPQRLLKNPSCQ